MSWVELAGGATLMSQGEPGDAMYPLVSGRLRAYIAHGDGAPPCAARELTELHFHPPLEPVGMLQWNRFDDIVRQGYEHACAVMDSAAAPATP